MLVPGAYRVREGCRLCFSALLGLYQRCSMSMTATAQWAALPDHSAEIARVREEFITAYGYEPDGVWSAPGRLNLFGRVH